MFKVVLWDYTGESAQWAKNFLKDGVEIIRTLQADAPDQAEVIMRGDWNFVLIFEKGQRELFNEIFKKLQAVNFSTDNIVFVNDFNSWLNHPAAVFALLKPQAHDQFYRHWNFYNQRRWHHYHSASAKGLHYVATAADNFVIRSTYVTSKSHASDELKLFHELVKKFYGDVDDSRGYFLELGANIGTTGIYFLKKLAPNLKWLAFEPEPENFKLLRVNTILNDLEDRATLVNCGLGDKFDELTMYRDLSNPGHNNFTEPKKTFQLKRLKSFRSILTLTKTKSRRRKSNTFGLTRKVLRLRFCSARKISSVKMRRPFSWSSIR